MILGGGLQVALRTIAAISEKQKRHPYLPFLVDVYTSASSALPCFRVEAWEPKAQLALWCFWLSCGAIQG